MPRLLFLVDFDNTLLDNDGVKTDIAARMRVVLGAQLSSRFWELYETVRRELDVVDFHEVLARMRRELPDRRAPVDEAARALAAWDFRPRLFPDALKVLGHLRRLGETFVMSDGDPLFQPTKVRQSGVTSALDGRVLVFAHKERYLEAFTEQFAADRYVLIDDKPGVLMRSKAILGNRLTTVFVRQGRYAQDPQFAVEYAPDLSVERIADLIEYGADDFSAPARGDRSLRAAS